MGSMKGSKEPFMVSVINRGAIHNGSDRCAYVARLSDTPGKDKA